MRYLGLFTLIIFIGSCQSDFELPDSETTDIIGSWELIELLTDPGDGSGQFESTKLDIRLEIDEHLNLKANGVLCGFSESESVLTGKISLADSIITATCSSGTLRHKFSLFESNLNLQNLSCRESCAAKFSKIK